MCAEARVAVGLCILFSPVPAQSICPLCGGCVLGGRFFVGTPEQHLSMLDVPLASAMETKRMAPAVLRSVEDALRIHGHRDDNNIHSIGLYRYSE